MELTDEKCWPLLVRFVFLGIQAGKTNGQKSFDLIIS